MTQQRCATANRLLQNQDDIGHAMAAFHGDEAGNALAGLLRDHILIAADLVDAAKNGDSGLVSSKLAAWYANADDIASFLAAANPAWSIDDLKAMRRTHLARPHEFMRDARLNPGRATSNVAWRPVVVVRAAGPMSRTVLRRLTPQRPSQLEERAMTATYTFEVFSSLDGRTQDSSTGPRCITSRSIYERGAEAKGRQQ